MLISKFKLFIIAASFSFLLYSCDVVDMFKDEGSDDTLAEQLGSNGNTGSIIYSNWTAINSGFGSYNAVQTLTTFGSNLFAGTQNLNLPRSGGVYLSTNNGVNWNPVNSGLTNSFGIPYNISSFAIIGTTIFVGTDNGLFRSSNNGQNWTAVTTGLVGTNITILSAIGTNLFAGANGNIVYRSTDNGSSWYSTKVGSITSGAVRTIVGNSSNLFVGITASGIYRSTDNGTSWISVNTGLASTNVVSIVILGLNLFAGTSDGGIFNSSNNGTNWAAINKDITNTSTLTFSGSNIFAGTFGGGVFLSSDMGAKWVAINSGLPNGTWTSGITGVYSFTITNNTLFSGTQNGIYKLQLP